MLDPSLSKLRSGRYFDRASHRVNAWITLPYRPSRVKLQFDRRVAMRNQSRPRVTWPIAAHAPAEGAHWPHVRGGRTGASKTAAARTGRRPGRLRASPAGRTLLVPP